MEIVIYTSDPDNIDPDEIAQAIKSLGYSVGSISVEV